VLFIHTSSGLCSNAISSKRPFFPRPLI
jgi:hypothetical protein